MRESLMYGSVRGARGNSRPYRDNHAIILDCCDAHSTSAVGQKPALPHHNMGVCFDLRQRTLSIVLSVAPWCQDWTHASQQTHYCSITSSARTSRVVGTARPSAFAVLRLIASSYLVGACTGRSAGFAPLRIPST
jgi:hypothetical protein